MIARSSSNTPVTLEAAEKQPMTCEPLEALILANSEARCCRSVVPEGFAFMGNTVAPTSRHGSKLLWCSRGPTRTVTFEQFRLIESAYTYIQGKTSSSLMARAETRVWTAPVQPEPVNKTASCSPAPVQLRTISLASCLYSVVCREVTDVVV